MKTLRQMIRRLVSDEPALSPAMVVLCRAVPMSDWFNSGCVNAIPSLVKDTGGEVATPLVVNNFDHALQVAHVETDVEELGLCVLEKADGTLGAYIFLDQHGDSIRLRCLSGTQKLGRIAWTNGLSHELSREEAFDFLLERVRRSIGRYTPVQCCDVGWILFRSAMHYWIH